MANPKLAQSAGDRRQQCSFSNVGGSLFEVLPRPCRSPLQRLSTRRSTLALAKVHEAYHLALRHSALSRSQDRCRRWHWLFDDVFGGMRQKYAESSAW